MLNDSPKQHQKQGHGTQILPICECWNLEGCDHADSQRNRDHIHDLWRDQLILSTIVTHMDSTTWNLVSEISFRSLDMHIRRCYHVVKEVHSPVEGLADACDVLEPLGAAVELADFIDGKAGGCDRKTCQHTHNHQDLEESLNTARRK